MQLIEMLGLSKNGGIMWVPPSDGCFSIDKEQFTFMFGGNTLAMDIPIFDAAI